MSAYDEFIRGTPGILAYWALDGSGLTIEDSVGGHDGEILPGFFDGNIPELGVTCEIPTSGGSLGWRTHPHGYLDGDAGRVLYDAALNTPEFAVECWMNGLNDDNDSADMGLISNMVSDQYLAGELPYGGWRIYRTASPAPHPNKFGVTYVDGGGVTKYRSGSVLPVNWNGQWTHVVVQYDGTEWSWYVNGVFQTSAVDTYTPNTHWPLYIAQAEDLGDGFHGRLCKVALYDRALDAGEIAARYSMGTSESTGGFFALRTEQHPTAAGTFGLTTRMVAGGTFNFPTVLNEGSFRGSMQEWDRDALAYPGPQIGDVIFNLTTGYSELYDGTDWVPGRDIVSQSLYKDNATLIQRLQFPLGITPPQITSNQNDYSPDNLAFTSVARLSSDASRNITGVDSTPLGEEGGNNGRLLLVHNIGSFDIVMKHDDVGSIAANRFETAGGTDATILPGGAALFIYDKESFRWRAIGTSGVVGGGGGVSDHTLLTGVTANQHHSQAHSISGADHTGSLPHSSTSGITETDHHAAPAAGPDADDTIDAAGAAGTASTFARSQHGHKVTTSAVTAAAVDQVTATAGTSGTISRAGHVHVFTPFYKSAAGATISDADFAATPPDGTIAITHNTTTGRSYMWARANGAWKSVQAT